jgi:hypothetical protein
VGLSNFVYGCAVAFALTAGGVVSAGEPRADQAGGRERLSAL